MRHAMHNGEKKEREEGRRERSGEREREMGRSREKDQVRWRIICARSDAWLSVCVCVCVCVSVTEIPLSESLMFVAKSLQSCRSHLQYVGNTYTHTHTHTQTYRHTKLRAHIILHLTWSFSLLLPISLSLSPLLSLLPSSLSFFSPTSLSLTHKILPTGQQQQQQQRSLQEFYETSVDACDGVCVCVYVCDRERGCG